MSRYIDANKLLKDEIARCHCVPLVGSGVDNFKLLKEVLEEAPTADVVEVVRCKDCEWWYDDGFDPILNCRNGKCGRPLGEHVNSVDFETHENDYCSYGGR